MAKEIVTTARAFHRDFFCVREGVPANDAVSFAETALEVSKGLLTDIVSDPSDENSVDAAFAARFLIEAALAAYRAAGAEA